MVAQSSEGEEEIKVGLIKDVNCEQGKIISACYEEGLRYLTRVLLLLAFMSCRFITAFHSI